MREKTIEQTTEQWTVAVKTIDLRDEIRGSKELRGICLQHKHSHVKQTL